MPRIVVIGVSRKNLPVNRLRLTQSARPLMLNGDGQGLGDRGHGYRTTTLGHEGGAVCRTGHARPLTIKKMISRIDLCSDLVGRHLETAASSRDIRAAGH